MTDTTTPPRSAGPDTGPRSDSPGDSPSGAGSGGRPRPGGRLSRRLGTGATQGFLGVWALLAAVPLLWALVSAFKTNNELFASPWKLPATWHFDNFVRAWTKADIGEYFLNTVVVVVGALALTMLLGSMAAYVLARFRFPGNRVVYYAFVAGMTFPVFLALVPLFFVVKNLNLLSSYPGLILVYTAYALPFTVFFLTGFFRTLPTSVAEAAVIDGCSQEGVFFRIMLPMAKPGLVSVAIFNFLGMWNQYLLPLVLNSDQHKYLLSQGLAALAVQQGYANDWSALFAGLVIAALPVVALYLALAKKVQTGLSVGLLK
ncbi:carbohydrate ABC transporter permease [Streptacidiphilus carbonis]|uniref:carbohydrate ABC transporter permease n=1 Tax=Streptacidiphilus carbonis TaxID=105422 RepID=UPI0005A96E74|nr:carbohydrate ABC transporter permease [Streptacidiphilus carbonis]